MFIWFWFVKGIFVVVGNMLDFGIFGCCFYLLRVREKKREIESGIWRKNWWFVCVCDCIKREGSTNQNVYDQLTSGICCRWCGGIAADKCVPFRSGSANPEIPAWRPPANASGNTVQVCACMCLIRFVFGFYLYFVCMCVSCVVCVFI